jgi:predicted dehydrogenase
MHFPEGALRCRSARKSDLPLWALAISPKSQSCPLSGIPKAKRIALVSRDKNKAARFAKDFKASAAFSADEFAKCLALPEVNAVCIATPPGEHQRFAVEAARTGKHVPCEKPLAATLGQSAAIVRTCNESGVRLMTAYRKYFEPSSLFVKKLIQNGSLGRIDVIHTAFSELHSPGVSPAWLLDANLAGGGPLMDLGIYCVNTGRWLVDEDPLEVVAQSWSRDTSRFSSVEEGITFRMLFPSGLVVHGSSTYSAVLSSFLTVQGTMGWVSLSPAFAFDEERHVTGKIAGRRLERKFKILDEFVLEIDAFAESIQRQRPIPPDGLQGHRDMLILKAIYESARHHKPIGIDYSFAPRGATSSH